MTKLGLGEQTSATANKPEPSRTPRTLLLTAIAAAGLAAAFLAMGPGGTDLSAQSERAQFATHHGLTPIDLSWYGGTNQFGYSLISQFVMAALGARVTGALAGIASALAMAAILARTGAKRPELGGIVAAVCIFGNLVSGRMTYALGLAFGLAALLALTDNAAGSTRKLAPHGSPKRRLILAAIAAFLAAATSPVAGLFVGLAGAALILSRKAKDGLTLGIAAVIPIGIISGIFGEGGWMNISTSDTRHGVALSMIAFVLVPYKPIRIGAFLSALGIIVADIAYTPVGLNAIRLPVMFCIPLLVALVRWKLPIIAVIVGLVWWWVPPVMIGDLHDAGTSMAKKSYYQPLLDKLDTLQPAARIEIPPTRDYWESVYVADEVPIARGWLRQIDIGRNYLFFNGSLTENSWRNWLIDNGVQYVALPDSTLSWVGSGEKRLIAKGMPYLSQIWSSAHWKLYKVAGSPGIAKGVTKADATSVTIRADKGNVPLKIRFSRWLTLDHKGACLAPSGRWATLKVSTPGTYRISSSLHLSQSARCARG